MVKHGKGKRLNRVKVMQRKAIKDHLGNKFSSVTDMCEYWGIKNSTYYKRLRYWDNLKDILETPVKVTGYKIACKDHLGNKFGSITDMCKHWGIGSFTFHSRIDNGWSLKEALTRKVACRDHLGNEFENQSGMCSFYGIKLGTYKDRRKKGMSLEEALTSPVKEDLGGCDRANAIKCIDHLGQEFQSVGEMCRYWKIDYTTYTKRRNRCLDIEKALTNKLYKR